MILLSDIKKYRQIVLDGERKLECEVECEVCPYTKKCGVMEKEILHYKPDTRSFSKELCGKTTIFPKIETSSEDRARKLYVLLVELELAYEFKKRVNAFDIAKTLGITVYRVRQRIKYLVEHNFVASKTDNIYSFSFGRNKLNIIRFYVSEFDRRFGYSPVVSTSDTSGLSTLIRDYSDDQLKILISAYFDLEDKFLSDCGYNLRFFPMKLNRLLIALSKKGHSAVSSDGSFTQDQLKEYIKGKNEGSWTGTESWAKPYESAINSVSK